MKQKKPISQITPFTTLDFAEHLACIVWFSGCNMRCDYCYNIDIVQNSGNITEKELIVFLQNRKSKLDGVVLSGGECTLYKGLKPLCQEIKKMGFKIKIDTNGSSPKVLSELLDQSLIDFVAMDFKAPKSKFINITKSNLYDKFAQSLELLLGSKIPYEVRTTIHDDLLSTEDINQMINFLHVKGYRGTYFLQNYLHVKTLGNLKEPTNKLNPQKLSKILNIDYRNF